MNIAIDFYQKFLGKRVTVRNDTFSIFNFHGFRLCLFNNTKVGEKVMYGGNCLLSFEVKDAEKLKNKLVREGIKIVYPITKLGKNFVFEFKDSKGNDVEVYSNFKR